MIIIAGGALRTTGLGTHSLWFDETMTLHLATHPDTLKALSGDRNPPLAFLLLKLWVHCLGEADMALRLLPACVSSATLVLLTHTLPQLIDKRVAYVSCALLAVSPFSIWYGQEVRTYYLVECGSALTVIGFLRLLDPGRGRCRTGLILACGTFLAVGSNYTGYLVGFQTLSAFLVLRLWDGKVSRVALVGPLVGGALWAPWYLIVVPQQLGNEWGFPTTPSLVSLIELPARLVIVEPRVLSGTLSWLAWVLVACTGLGLAWAAVDLVLRRNKVLILCVTLFCAPIIGSFLTWLVAIPVFGPRYFVVSEIPLVLTMALGACARAKFAKVMYVGVFICGLVGMSLAHKCENLREDFRSACRCVEANWRSGDRIASLTGTFDGVSESALRHYLRHRPDILSSLVRESEILGNEFVGSRMHVVFREAPYSWPTYKALLERWTIVHEYPMRLRVQYLLFQRRG
jgi:hypothetical protein